MKNLEEWRKFKQVEVYGDAVYYKPKVIKGKAGMDKKVYPFVGKIDLLDDAWVELEATFRNPAKPKNETRHYRLYVGDVQKKSMKGVAIDLEKGSFMVFVINQKLDSKEG